MCTVIHFVAGTDADRKQFTQSGRDLKEYLDGEFVIRARGFE